MEFTKLPTDNFYIFISLAGTLIVVFFINFIANRRTKIEDAISLIEQSLIQHKHDINLFAKKTAAAKFELKFLIERFNKKFRVNYDDFIKFENTEFKIPTDLQETNEASLFLEEFIKINRLKLTLDEELNKTYKTTDLISNETKLNSKKFKDYIFLENLAIFFIVVGILLSCFGYSSWYFKYQKYQDKMLKNSYEKSITRP
jgi:hypothetical protein